MPKSSNAVSPPMREVARLCKERRGLCPRFTPSNNLADADLAALVVPTIGDNRMRHEALQRFMLANDSVTLATEVPIWISPAMITELEREHGIALLPEKQRGSLTGHIDFLQ